MKIIAVSGSPRKGWNTDLLLSKALEGAEAAGAQTELIHLYDLTYTGCRSCFACKLRGGKSLGRCAINDGLKPVLEKIDAADGLILGSPVYFGDVSAMMRAFLERLIYQYTNFDGGKSFFSGHLRTGFVYTMNAPDGAMAALTEKYKGMLSWYFDYMGTVSAAETLQTADYGKYHFGMFNEAQRKSRRETEFPKDCQNACELGRLIAAK